jgi:hypothetical protein
VQEVIDKSSVDEKETLMLSNDKHIEEVKILSEAM